MYIIYNTIYSSRRNAPRACHRCGRCRDSPTPVQPSWPVPKSHGHRKNIRRFEGFVRYQNDFECIEPIKE